MMLPITLKKLESFVAVTEEQNFLRAAKRLRRSQSAIYESIVALFAEQGRVRRPKFELTHHQSLCGLVAAGLGVTVMPASALPPDAPERFHAAHLVEPERARELGLIFVKGNTLSPAAEAFADLAAERQDKG